MIKKELKINNFFLYWLITTFILVFLIIIVGGLTRLTDSGLSITEWELIKGIIPPLTEQKWNFYFDQYKKIPQYELIYYNMTLEKFKVIFFWEYFHRNLARFIGLFFLFPFLYFYFSKKINKNEINFCFVILSLIIFQGIIGWYMVQSGLTNDVTVSHYRLSIHLTTAIIIISLIFWLIKSVITRKNKNFFIFSKQNIPFQLLIFLIFLQIVMGAFVSGLDAGKIYQTWPLMGNNYFPNDLFPHSFINFFELNNHSLVQFYHRNLAYLIVFYYLFLNLYIYKKKIFSLYNALKISTIILLLQIGLGILTLISGLNIYLASMHQITSVLLILSALNLYFIRAK